MSRPSNLPAGAKIERKADRFQITMTTEKQLSECVSILRAGQHLYEIEVADDTAKLRTIETTLAAIKTTTAAACAAAAYLFLF